MSDTFIEIELTQQPIELYKLLKIADLVSGGGEAKVVISEGYVLLNGEVEYQKRKKVYHEDVIEFNGEIIQLVINEALDEEDDLLSESAQEEFVSPTPTTTQKKNKAPKANKPAQKQTPINNTEHVQIDGGIDSPSPRKRRPISFK